MSKLYPLINALSPVEKKRFDKYIASPFFNSDKSEVINNLWAIVKNVGKKQPSDAELAAQLYPDKKDKDKGAAFVRKAKSALYGLIEQFITHCILLDDAEQVKRSQLLALSKHQQNKTYEIIYAAQKEALTDIKCPGISLYQLDYELHVDYYNHLLATNNRHPDSNKLRLLVSRKFDLYYAANQISWLVNLLSGNDTIYPLPAAEMVQVSSDTHELLSFIERKDLLREPIIKAYYHLAHLFLRKSIEAHWIDLQNWFHDYAKYAQRDDLLPIFKLACNYPIKEYGKGNVAFLKYADDFYTMGLERKLLPENNYFIPADFKNIVTLKCRLQQLDDAKHFVEKYSHLLPPEYSSLSEYFKGQIAFYKNDFVTSLQYLEQAERKDNIGYIEVNRLLIKAYFGLIGQAFYSQLLENRLNTVRVRLYQMEKQKNITTNTKEAMLTFIAYCEKLFLTMENTLNNRKKKAALLQLRTDIAANYTYNDKDWLLDYCEKNANAL
jgi:hypothetical protein